MPKPAQPHSALRTARLIALVTGVLGALLAIATPFLPVVQTTAVVNWPQGPTVQDVDAPLMSQVPLDVTASIPCASVNALGQGGLLLATAPPQGENAPFNAMFVRVSPGSVDVLTRNAVVASAPRDQLAGCTSIDIHSDTTSTRAAFVGTTFEGELKTDERPQVVGIYSDLEGAAPQGLSFSMTVDSRFSSRPTIIKTVAMAGALLCTLLALAALSCLDGNDGRRHRRYFPAHWLRPTLADGGVVGTLVVWHFIGANTSDDGYLLTMARVADHAGYMANYFRWYGVPEAPFGWYYDVIELFAKVSTASPWVRLPALLCAIGCWFVISREVVPRLGRAARYNTVALWTGGLVFLCFWLPYDNGLRSEPIVAFGALLTWCSVERAIAMGRLLPFAVAALVGAFTLAAAPTGLACVAALLAGIRPIVRLVVRKRREFGTLPLLAPIAAAGFLVLTVVYNDQTFAGIQEANRVRRLVGPNLDWNEDYVRYYWLFVETVDGSLPRRFAFLLMLFCLLTTLVVMLRRRRIPGVAPGPAWRLTGVVFGTMFFMMFNPTKWTHHMGAYAGIAGALGALTAVAVSASALRSRRNRSMFLAGVVFMLALAFSGINGYWWVSSYGVPWFDKLPQLKGIQANTVLLALFFLAVALVAWQYLREGYAPPMPKANTQRGRRIRAFAAAPLTVIAALMVLFEVLSLAKGYVSQYPAFSVGRANVDALRGSTCGLANDVLVETDPNGGRLIPIIDPANPPKNGDALAGGGPVGFDPNGVPDDLTADAVEVKPGTGNSEKQGVAPAYNTGQDAGTGGGQGAKGVNGSTVKLPYGLDPATTPILGSYQTGVQEIAKLTSSWYQLPPRSSDSPVVVIAAAGRIMSHDDTGKLTFGMPLTLEYGKRQPDGSFALLGSYEPRDIGPSPSWRNLRVPIDALGDADVVRIKAEDWSLTGEMWLAFTPPRVPKLQTLDAVVGHEQPVLLDWAVGLQFPCQRPFDHRLGVAEVPGYRILPDRELAVSSTDTWQSHEKGGPLGFTEMLSSSTTIPTYLKGDWARDWGSLERYDRHYSSAVPAQITEGEATRSGFWMPAKVRAIG